MSELAYLQRPNLFKETIVFVTDDDLWSVPLQGGIATRLTTSKGHSHSPHISPDGKSIAYLSNDHGQQDVYIIPLKGGIPKRLSYFGVQSISGFKNNKTLLVSSNHESFHLRVTQIYEINIELLTYKKLKYGHASSLNFDDATKKSVLGKNIGDPAKWKRYRGGTAGTLWVDEKGDGSFKQILKKLPTNLANPIWINSRLFFISDHEGVSNIYSSNSRGTGLKRHTENKEFYIRSFSHYNGEIVFQSDAQIYQYSLSNGVSKKIPIHIGSTFSQAIPRYEYASDYLDDYDLSPDASQVALMARGQLFVFRPWDEGPFRLGRDYYRYKCPQFFYGPQKGKDAQRELKLLAVELDERSEERLILFNCETFKSELISPKTDIGKVTSFFAAIKSDHIAFINNRSELWLLNIKTKKLLMIDQDKNSPLMTECSWSPCSRYLAYSSSVDKIRKGIYLYDTQKKKKRLLINPILSDSSPVFDPNGDYIYFIGMREFRPQYYETHFDLGFPSASRPYAINLKQDFPSPLNLHLNFEIDEEDDENELKSKVKNKEKTVRKEKKESIHIDWEGIDQRIITLPFDIGGYESIVATQDKIFVTRSLPAPINPHSSEADESSKLFYYDLKEKKIETFHKKVLSWEVSLNHKYFMIESAEGLRIVSADSKPSDGDSYGKKDGWIDIDKISLYIDPKKEWRQMYQEAWILQREHFWNPDMSKVDWEKIYYRYLPLVDQTHTRREFSDLMWEMQGELGTSHCYEMQGDYFRRPPTHHIGKLAATLKWDNKQKSLEIIEIAKGDSWINSAKSPLSASEVSLNKGDLILGIDGREFVMAQSLDLALENRAGEMVNLLIKRKGNKKSEYVQVVTNDSSTHARYRDWVEKNKEYVHRKSKGKLGYLHIPNMAPWGHAEFYRHYLSEHQYSGLIIDVRYNGGGHISQHLLKILAQKVMGFDQTRYWGAETFPALTVNGPLVCLTNEHAGSDGDIFSHTFKLMKLGKLVGKRTWGGVVGIWPRQTLIDGSLTSQPEFSFWFKDVGWNVENYGTDPDIEIENTPQDWAKGLDAQLKKSVEVALKDLKKTPPLHPDLKKSRPNLGKRPILK